MEGALSRDHPLTDEEQDQAFARAVDQARERAKALYLQKVRDSTLNAVADAFDEGFEAAMDFYASEEFEVVSDSTPRH